MPCFDVLESSLDWVSNLSISCVRAPSNPNPIPCPPHPFPLLLVLVAAPQLLALKHVETQEDLFRLLVAPLARDKSGDLSAWLPGGLKHASYLAKAEGSPGEGAFPGGPGGARAAAPEEDEEAVERPEGPEVLRRALVAANEDFPWGHDGWHPSLELATQRRKPRSAAEAMVAKAATKVRQPPEHFSLRLGRLYL